MTPKFDLGQPVKITDGEFKGTAAIVVSWHGTHDNPSGLRYVVRLSLGTEAVFPESNLEPVSDD